MATHTLSTKFSRRNMLSGISAIGLSAAARPSHAALPISPAFADPNAELLCRIALAERRREEFNATRLEHLRMYRALLRHPDYPWPEPGAAVDGAMEAGRAELAERVGYRAAYDRRDRACGVYNAAARAVLDTPPRTLRGLYAKLRFATLAAREGDYGGYDHGDRDWLDNAMADAARMADPDRA